MRSSWLNITFTRSRNVNCQWMYGMTVWISSISPQLITSSHCSSSEKKKTKTVCRLRHHCKRTELTSTTRTIMRIIIIILHFCGLRPKSDITAQELQYVAFIVFIIHDFVFPTFCVWNACLTFFPSFSVFLHDHSKSYLENHIFFAEISTHFIRDSLFRRASTSFFLSGIKWSFPSSYFAQFFKDSFISWLRRRIFS